MAKQFQLKIRIDWSELDMFGHVNNVSYFKYIQASRVNFWQQMGIDVSRKPHPIGLMLASCTCKFMKPLFYPGELFINVTVDFIKNTSFGFHHQLLNEKHELVAEAHDVMVMFDFEKNEKVLIPGELRLKME
ncbi:MAG: acyl-CoA thioesterase [Bacteroidia bacterium]